MILWQQPVICIIFEFKLQASWSLVHLEIYQLRSDLFRILKKHIFKAFNYSLQLSNLQQQRIMVEQLRREAAIKRVNVSQAIEDIKVNENVYK